MTTPEQNSTGIARSMVTVMEILTFCLDGGRGGHGSSLGSPSINSFLPSSRCGGFEVESGGSLNIIHEASIHNGVELSVVQLFWVQLSVVHLHSCK